MSKWQAIVQVTVEVIVTVEADDMESAKYVAVSQVEEELKVGSPEPLIHSDSRFHKISALKRSMKVTTVVRE